MRRICSGFVLYLIKKRMKTKFGAIIVDGRGKINGFVASKNRAGSYLRTKVTPVNPQSASQQAGRAIITNLSQAWRGLTQPQRDSWIAAVNDWQHTDIFGDLKTPSGFNLYMQQNGKLSKADAGVIASAPTPVDVDPLTNFTVALDNSGDTIVATFAATPVPANHKLIIDSTGPVPAGISFVKNKWRRVANLNAAVATGIDFGATYYGAFGDIQTGQEIQFRACMMNTNTGQTSAWIYTTSTVVA